MGIFFLLSVPIFYIIGVVAAIHWLSTRSTGKGVKRRRYLEEVISELEAESAKSPDKKVSQLLSEYKKELEGIRKLEKVSVPATPEHPVETASPTEKPAESAAATKPVEPKKASFGEDLDKFWTNWYSENSINLLLYIGAFLIVASASIYVGFQWETLGGVFKAFMLTILSLAFFGFGAWFFSIPKIKNAGATFIAIGAVLIPFNGLAWHNFVLEPAGYSFGFAWLFTSIIAISVYSLLAYVIRHPFYTYIAGFGSLSMVLSIVNVADVNQEFYILGGIFSSLVLLVSARLFNQSDLEAQKSYVTPLNISAHIIMPLSLLWGLVFALNSDRLFTAEVVLSVFLAGAYYLTAYVFTRKISFLSLSQVLLLVTVFIFGGWMRFEYVHTFIIIQLILTIYLLASYYLVDKWKEESESFSTIAHIGMPASLFLVLMLTSFESALANSTSVVSSLFTLETTLSIGLTTAFYILAYLFKRSIVFVAIASSLFLFFIYFAGRWLGLGVLSIYYLLEIVIITYLVATYYIKNNWLEETKALTIVSLAFAAGIFFLAFGRGDFTAFHLTVFAAFPTVFGLLASYVQKESNYLYYNFIFLAITVYLYFNNLLGLGHTPYILGSAYLGITVIFYLITVATRNIKGSFQAFALATLTFSVLAFIFTANKPAYFLVANIVYASILFDAALRFKDNNLIYLSNLFIYVGLWSILRIFEVKIDWYPLSFAGLSYFVYAASQILPESLKKYYRLTSLVGIGANTLAFGLAGQNTYNSYDYNYSASTRLSNDIERNALLSSYAAFFLYTFDATIVRKASLGYFATAVGMFTYLWQMKFLGIDETQVYTLPLGIYFMSLAYIQRITGKESNRMLLDYVGLFFLLVPTLFQSFNADGAKYALLLGIEGVIILALGISLSYKTYLYAGIAAIAVAVISQTYEFIFSLPRWLITAVAGLGFLGTAIYLLLHRKESPKQ